MMPAIILYFTCAALNHVRLKNFESSILINRVLFNLLWWCQAIIYQDLDIFIHSFLHNTTYKNMKENFNISAKTHEFFIKAQFSTLFLKIWCTNFDNLYQNRQYFLFFLNQYCSEKWRKSIPKKSIFWQKPLPLVDGKLPLW